MKLNTLTIIIILLIIYHYPDVVNKITQTILGKLILIVLLTIICLMDLLSGILLLFVVLLLSKNNHLENFDIIKDFSVSKNNTRYKEPFITSSNEIMNLENKLRNR